jgi:uroporphyrinogen decarboxylase
MSKIMDHRERVRLAIEHQEPDRVPIAVWGSAYGISDPLYQDLLQHYNLGAQVKPFRRLGGHSVNHYDDRLMEVLDIDVRHVWLGFTDLGGPPKGGGVDSWGIGWEDTGVYLGAFQNPLVNATVADLESYPWPDVEGFIRREELRERARYLKEQTDYFVVGRAVDSYGPLEKAGQLRGYEKFMFDLVIEEDFVHVLVDKITDVLCRLLEIYLDTAGPYLDMIELPGDDYSAQNPIISPAMFDKYFAASWRRMIGLIREAAPNCRILFHSDGKMDPFLGRLIDLGVDVYHGVEPMPEVDMVQLKRDYGEQICFWGGIDLKEAMRGEVVEVESEVRERVEVLAPGGGYILAPSNHLQSDVPAENVVALFRAAREFGVYG